MSKELLDANSIVFVLPAFLSSGYVVVRVCLGICWGEGERV